MAPNEQLHKLDGSQEILVSENGDTVARLEILALSNLQGQHVKIEHAQSVSRLGLGMALCSAGLGAIYSVECLQIDEVRDILALITEVVEKNCPSDPDSIPF